MRPLYITLLTMLISVSSNAQTHSSEDVQPYDFKTTLKEGYTILFKVDDSMQYLYLKIGNKTIKEISSTSRGLPYKNLGYVVTDFKEYFVLVHSFGSGNPHNIELIKKSNGVNILDKLGAWIDANEEKEILLFSANEIPTKNSKMILFHAKTNQKELFSFPSDILGQVEVFNRITILRLTEKEFVIEYDSNGQIKQKVYSR